MGFLAPRSSLLWKVAPTASSKWAWHLSPCVHPIGVHDRQMELMLNQPAELAYDLSDIKSWLTANVNWSSELLKCFSINDKCSCWLFCLLWHHKTFQEIASLDWGKEEEVPALAFMVTCLNVLTKHGWRWHHFFCWNSSSPQPNKQIIFLLNSELFPSGLIQPPCFGSHQ